ncbi:substrate-binding periplasmic protein [Roseateles violae]|uniref:Transporter substrate-binding domain-containing protein n=1 Tax=Roseateles violae TaxID=3058042 RepID=A0ABT8DZD1_9BURK|nr:transporter substrate-binding domain-containing protein [Pelomonas sp. PFR6]MDN3922953.1 transporter substrate-binding domain-containing protein [Pelomonas sp. PFR6]
MRRRAVLCLLPALGLAAPARARVAPADSRELPLYNYQTEAAYAAWTPGGLTPQLAHWLTELSGGRYRFVPTQLPRPRLDRLLAGEAWTGVLAWSNPRWIGDPQRQRFRWSGLLLRDLKLLVSHRERPVDYRGPDSLAGQRLGTVRSHRYGPLAEAMAAGRIQYEAVSDEESNLAKLQRRRIDATFISAVALLRLRRLDPDGAPWLYVSRPPLANDRYLCCQRDDPALAALLDRATAAFAQAPQWQTLHAELRELARQRHA